MTAGQKLQQHDYKQQKSCCSAPLSCIRYKTVKARLPGTTVIQAIHLIFLKLLSGKREASITKPWRDMT